MNNIEIKHLEAPNVVYPHGDLVEIHPSIDFVYIMKKDGHFSMAPIIEKMSHDYAINPEALEPAVSAAYDEYFSHLTYLMQWAFSYKGNIELHVFEPDELEMLAKSKSVDFPLISLDPQIVEGVYNFQTSRAYYPGGVNEFGQVARPGSPSLEEQASAIATLLSGERANITEDDIFSGGSVTAALEILVKNGVNIESVIPGIQIGDPAKIKRMGIDINPVTRYQVADNLDIFDIVDLGDPRDFLIGAAGLVVKLPNEEYGRAPYVLPFVSPSARASIPNDKEQEFSQSVLTINEEFFRSIEEQTGYPLLLKHMDQYFVQYMTFMYNLDENMPMTDIIEWSRDHFTELRQLNTDEGFVDAIRDFQLPNNLIFLDLNGTLIPEDSTDGSIPVEHAQEFMDTVAELKHKGYEVGLCSDSPLPQLETFAEVLGLSGPIIAENGNIISYAGRKIKINEVAGIDQIKKSIALFSEGIGYMQTDDVVAVEFGGAPPDYSKNAWSFGANRQTSVSVFGPSEYISQLYEFLGNGSNNSIDGSPEYNYFAIHPGDMKKNKGKALSYFSIAGHMVKMIGNSMSDWVDPNSGVECSFVASSRIPDTIASTVYVSGKPVIEGVVDILQHEL